MGRNLSRYKKSVANGAFARAEDLFRRPDEERLPERVDTLVHLACSTKHRPDEPRVLQVGYDLVDQVRGDILAIVPEVKSGEPDDVRQKLLVVPNDERPTLIAQELTEQMGIPALSYLDEETNPNAVRVIPESVLRNEVDAKQWLDPEKTGLVLVQDACSLVAGSREALRRFTESQEVMCVGLVNPEDERDEDFNEFWGRHVNVTDDGEQVIYRSDESFKIIDRKLHLHKSLLATEFDLSDAESRYDDSVSPKPLSLTDITGKFGIRQARGAKNRGFYPAEQVSRFTAVDENGFLHLCGEVYGLVGHIVLFMNKNKKDGERDTESTNIGSQLKTKISRGRCLEFGRVTLYPLSEVRKAIPVYAHRLKLGDS